MMRGAGALLLQREVPEAVNARAARIAAAAGVPVILDCGGVEGPISDELLRDVTVLSPNETELARLTGEAPVLAPCACHATLSTPASFCLFSKSQVGSERCWHTFLLLVC